MRRILPFALLAALAAGCSSTNVAAPPSAATSSPPSPTPTADPVCSSSELRAFLSEIDRYTARGAFEVEPRVKLARGDVSKWSLALGSIEHDAELKAYKATKDASDAVQEWLGQDPGSLAQKIDGMSIQTTAKTLALECGVSDDYAFSRIE